jgi:hypothetical protein
MKKDDIYIISSHPRNIQNNTLTIKLESPIKLYLRINVIKIKNHYDKFNFIRVYK